MNKVYVAGALNAMAKDYNKNIHKMIVWADKVRRAGHSVYVPCLDILSGIVIGDYEYGDYFYNSQPWLEAADAVFVCPGWENSKGTIKEIERANTLNIPVVYSIEELKNAL